MWIPHDGRVIPADVAQALAAGARIGGAQIVENTAVTEVLVDGCGVTGVRTPQGDILSEVVVNCAGMWARELGARSGVTIPVFPVEHFYAVTRPVAGITPDLAVLRDLDGHVYIREEVGGILIGGFEPRAKPWRADPIPEDFAFSLLKEDRPGGKPCARHAVTARLARPERGADEGMSARPDGGMDERARMTAWTSAPR